jgi:hypothetical protein
MKEEMCLVNSCTTNSILRKTKYFQTRRWRIGAILTIAWRDANIAGSGEAIIVLPMGTEVTINNALLYPDSTRTLLSYRDIHKNELHVVTHKENNEEFIYIIKKNGTGHNILERIHFLPYWLYYIYINHIPHVAYKVIFQNVDTFTTWHERLGYPGIGTMRKIIGNSTGHNLNTTKFPKSSNFMCISCATGKLIMRPSPLKIEVKPLKFLERILEDICGPIQSLSGPFRYFMVLIDAYTRWSHVCLLSTHNHTFAQFWHIIRLKTNFPKHQLQYVILDNTIEFSSKAFSDYCMAQGIKVQHSMPYVHTQNGLAESLIKRIKLITRPLLHNCNLPITYCGHAVLHAADLIQLRPTAYHSTSPLYLVRGNALSISHLGKFGCIVYAPIWPQQRTTMGPHKKIGIYVVYYSPSIIKYLKPMTGDLFMVWYTDCIFNEDYFPTLGGEF